MTVGYADDSTLLCRIPHPRDRSSVAASLNDDLALISDWCSRWGMLVNPSKTRRRLISCSRMVEPLFPDLVTDGTVVEMFSEFNILGVILDSKLAFEKQVRAIAASASRRVGILRKKMSVFSRCRCCCQMLLGIHVPCTRVLFSSLCVFFKIDSLVDHPVRGLIPAQYLLRRLTHGAFAAHSRFLRCLGLELCRLCALLFCLVFDCGMDCINLSLLVKVWILLKLQSIAFFYKVDCPLFLPSLWLFLFHFSFSRDLR